MRKPHTTVHQCPPLVGRRVQPSKQVLALRQVQGPLQGLVRQRVLVQDQQASQEPACFSGPSPRTYFPLQLHTRSAAFPRR
mmetsp:Transcript_35378/g.71461  ORF Transcript_35378/g.71461 Transcript_35378/m.71461 type:complete len:81 (-) Transcript_35378:224-466(-)